MASVYRAHQQSTATAQLGTSKPVELQSAMPLICSQPLGVASVGLDQMHGTPLKEDGCVWDDQEEVGGGIT